MTTIKRAHDCRVGDILINKNEASRVITDIDHRGKAYLLRTTTLSGENSRFDTYDAPDEVNVWGTQEALF